MFDTFYIVGRVLPRKIMVARIKYDAVLTGFIIINGGSQFPTVADINKKTSYRISTVIQADCIRHFILSPIKISHVSSRF